MKIDQIFTQWCVSVVPKQIGAIVTAFIEEGGSFDYGTKTQMSIAGVDPIHTFELPLPDQICWPDGSGPYSQAALDTWVTTVSDSIFKLWDKSYNGKKHKLIDDLKMFAIVYPKMAQDLLSAVEFKDGDFQFDLQKKAYGEIPLILVKFEEFQAKRKYNVSPIIKP